MKERFLLAFVTLDFGVLGLMRLLTQMSQFVVPAMITMTVAATRLHRSLTNFSSPPDTYDILPFDLPSSTLLCMLL